MTGEQTPSHLQCLKLQEEQNRMRLETAMAKLVELGDMMDQLPFRERQHVARVLHIVAERASRKLPIDTRSRNEASITAHAHLAMVAYHSS